MTKLVIILALLSPAWAQQTLQQMLDSGARSVQAPAGTIQLSAPLTITTNGQTIDFSASTLVCNFDADCVVVGNPANYNGTANVTLLNPHGAPTIKGGTHSFITVFGQKTRIINVTSAPTPPGQPWGTFGHLVTVVGDQAFLLDGLDTTSGGFNVRCDAAFCGSWVYAPGPFYACAPWCAPGTRADNAAVGWLTHMQLSAQCQGNGVDWQSGNTLRISDSVIQGYAQFGIRTGIWNGGYGGTTLDNVYEDTGCSGYNPLGNVGSAGVIMQGGFLSIHSDRQPHGDTPIFSQTGSNLWYYFVAMNKNPGGWDQYHQMPDGSWSIDSVPLLAGQANTDGTTPINGQFPSVPGVAVYYVLRVPTWGPIIPPQGTGNWLVATVSAASCTSICSFIDSGTPASYTTVSPTQPNRDATYIPSISFWPGDLLILQGNLRTNGVLSNEPLGRGDRYVINSTWRPGN